MFRFHSNSKLISPFRITIFILAFFLCSFSQVQAASLTVSPSILQTTVGNNFSIHIAVGTNGKSINNSDGTIQFPADLLQVVSLSKNSSIFTMWVEEPKFSNIDGTITWNGGVPNPGYIGESGEVLTVTFRAKEAGTAAINFSSAAIRQNDGLGTDILSSKNVGTIEVDASTQAESLPSPEIKITKPIINIVKSTEPVKFICITATTSPFLVDNTNILLIITVALFLLSIIFLFIFQLERDLFKAKKYLKRKNIGNDGTIPK